ncbi:polysaccharide biosynthesis/export family protein [Novosphingopyxis iocasae]|uniref:polysaccharide biosynthesis/export family protein n=1 Tax=Novosphingopyxis iocasae TaxID=2762729 RepID=UPI001FEA4BA2|nr:polysaccharide biosynthesis/export family protein [Novosphingopyxis iocasae]
MRILLLPAFGLALLSGCAGNPPPVSSADLTVLQDGGMPVPGRTDVMPEARQAVIGPLDKLGIDVYGISELSMQALVDGAGQISMPLVGVLEVGGKTPSEVSREIERQLRTYVRDPSVSVNLLESVSQAVTVDGAVIEPGLYPVSGNMTLMRTIASAKGLTESAKLDDVVILRTVGDQRYAGLYNLGAIRRGAYADPTVYANDVVIVGDSPMQRFLQNVAPLVPLVTTPLIVLLQRNGN